MGNGGSLCDALHMCVEFNHPIIEKRPAFPIIPLMTDIAIPIGEEVKGACEILGLDPLYVANEGKLLAIVPPEAAAAVLATMQAHPLGAKAAIIGEVTRDHPRFVTMRTRVGGTRIVDMLSGEQLPRIC
jgi:Hydrogenase maturation factor